jgi:murein DD-endopeptidase MepM/ murein hydrolase activator NlpD
VKNQALVFGLLGAGGILLVKAVTGSSFADILAGHPAAVSTAGQSLLANGVAGVGQAASGAVSPRGGVNPLPGLRRWERTDQGVDASATPGTPVHAVVAGTVTDIIPFYRGQPAVIVSSPGLPAGATGIYYAEQLAPTVKIGDTLAAGQQIGTVAPSGTGLELGFWQGSRTLAQATGGYVEGQATHAGELFRQFLISLGVPA